MPEFGETTLVEDGRGGRTEFGVDDVFEEGDYGQAKYHTMDPNDPYRIARTHDFIDEIEPTPAMPIVCHWNISPAFK